MTTTDDVFSPVLAKRARATLEFGRRVAAVGDLPSRSEKIRAYRFAANRTPKRLLHCWRRTHAGYYGVLNPLMLAVGWTAGGAPQDSDPADRFVLGRPAYGAKTHSHIGLLCDLFGRVLQSVTTGVLDRTDAHEFGEASVHFANVTAEQRRATEPDFRGEPSPFVPMFEEVVRTSRPLLIVSTGGESWRHFFSRTYPALSLLPRVHYAAANPASRAAPKPAGLWQFPNGNGENLPIAFLQLPRHPSFAGRFMTFREGVVDAATGLVRDILIARGDKQLP